MIRKYFERLPTNVTPKHYTIGLTSIDLEKHLFEGRVTIKVDVNRPTKDIKLNASGLTLSNVTFSSDKRLNAGEVKLNVDDEIVDIIFESSLEVGEGVFIREFSFWKDFV